MRSTTTAIHLVFLFGFLLIASYLLLAEPIIGLADHGDYFRIMNPLGLAFAEADPEKTEFWYVQRHYNFVEPAGGLYASSEEWLIQLAIFLDNLITKDLRFSLRFAGFMHILVITLGLAVVLFFLKSISTLQRLLLYLLLLACFADVGYLAWYNSLYSEPALQIFLVFSIGFAIALAESEPPARRRPWLIVGYYISVVLFLLSKPQAAAAGLVLAPLGILLAIRWRVPSRTYFFHLTAGLAALVLSATLLMRGQPDYMREANLYNIVFGDLLKHADDPEEAMRELGIYDSDFVPLIGLTIYDNVNPIVNSPEFRQKFYSRIGYGAILRFYYNHPDHFYQLAARCAEEPWSVRPPSMGNYEEKALEGWGVTEAYKVSGLPIQTHAFELWGLLKTTFLPNHILFILIFLGAGGLAGLVFLLRPRANARQRSFALIYLALVVLTLQQYLVAIIGEGEISIIKHLYPFNVLFDMVLIFTLVWIAGILPEVGQRWQMRRGPVRSPRKLTFPL